MRKQNTQKKNKKLNKTTPRNKHEFFMTKFVAAATAFLTLSRQIGWQNCEFSLTKLSKMIVC